MSVYPDVVGSAHLEAQSRQHVRHANGSVPFLFEQTRQVTQVAAGAEAGENACKEMSRRVQKDVT